MSRSDLAVKYEATQTPLDASSRDLPRILAISFWYPPKTEPRAIQVSRLLKYLKTSTVLVSADQNQEPQQNTASGLGDTESFLQANLRVPLALAPWRKFVDRVAGHVYLPIWARTPDPLVPWKGPVVRSVTEFIKQRHYRPSALVTFAFPLIDHLIGLELKRLYGYPWLAHFSDPWLDNPFKTDDPLTRALNAGMERNVIEQADRVVFTSQETANLVMRKYEPGMKAKVRIVPHAYERDLFVDQGPAGNRRMTIRYLGDLYLDRSPKPLFTALRTLAASRPDLLKDVCFEIVGSAANLKPDDLDQSDLPANLVSILPRVGYIESLSLMSSADGLMVIDAPAVNGEKSVFLPSKLIEYIGAGRPIIGLTPPGAAADVINRLGGWVADPSDDAQVVTVLEQFLSFLIEHRDESRKTWGRSDERRKYEAPVVAEKFEEALLELI